MSKINFCALGGLGENGKNLYLVTVNDKIFILDCGIKYPSVDLYGVDAVMPDFEYLIANKDRIIGIFLSHGHDENCGAIGELLRELKVPVYGSHYTISYVEQILTEHDIDIKNYKLYRINDEKVLSFDDVTVSFFYTTHSVPESMGISINTEDGSIVYAPDFTFAFTKDQHYSTSFKKLCEVTKNNVLLLCPESIGVNNINRVNNDYNFNFTINDALSNQKRIVFAMYSSDLNRIQKVIDFCVQYKRRIAIIGRKVQRNVNVAMNIGYLKVPNENLVNLRFLDEFNSNDEDDLAIIITGIRHEPYFMLQRMMTNQDKLIRLKKDDTVVTICPPVIGTERIATRAIDQLSKTGCKVIDISRKNLKSSHADSEDLKMLYQILKPMYILPVAGEYRHQYVHKKLAIDAGYREDRIIVLDNGIEIEFDNGLITNSTNKINVSDVLVDGSIVGDINEVVLKDREQLSEEGVIIVVVNIDSKKFSILSGPAAYAKGFMSLVDINELLDKVCSSSKETIKKVFSSKTIDWNDLKNQIRENCSKEIRLLTKKAPIVIPVIIDVNGEDL